MNSSTAESQIADFLSRYTPAMEAQLGEARSRLRRLFPKGYELVFDNYNALVFGISPTDRTGDSFISVTGYPKWVTLFFLYGAGLQDPEGLLQGEGKQVRGIRLKRAEDIDTPPVRALIVQAARPYEAALNAAPATSTIIKSVVAKQRSRRPAGK